MLGVCFAGAAFGYALLLVKWSTPGAAGAASFSWPQTQPTARGRQQLVVFLNPHCPCSRVTVQTLGEVLAGHAESVDLQVYVSQAGPVADLQQSDLIRAAAALPGAKVVNDHDGDAAARFGAQTSGSVMLYDAQGRLEFSGGITAGRGHLGSNAGADALLQALEHHTGAAVQLPVYGCALR